MFSSSLCDIMHHEQRNMATVEEDDWCNEESAWRHPHETNEEEL